MSFIFTLATLSALLVVQPAPPSTSAVPALDGGSADAGVAPSAVSPGAAEETAPVAGVTVTFRSEELFKVYAPAGKLDPAQRAVAIAARLLTASAGPAAADQVRTIERSNSTDVLVGDTLIVALTDEDAAPAGLPRGQLALQVSARVRTVLAREQRERSLKGLSIAGGYTALATLLLVLLLLALRAGHPRLRARLQRWRPGWIPTLRLGSVALLSPERVGAGLVYSAKLSTLALALLAIAVYLNTVLSFFPWTRGFAKAVAIYVFHALVNVLMSVAGYLPNLVYLAIIFFFVRWILKLLKLVADELGKGTVSLKGFHQEWAEPTYKIVRFLVLALAAVVAFPYLPGSKSPAFQGVSIFVGVLFSLGSSSAIGNVVAGVALTYMRPFAIGDRVQIADTVGDVIETGMLVVRVRTIKNVEVTIANSMVLGNHIINYSACARKEGLILHTSVTIGYDAPWRQVHELLIAAARSTEGILPEPAPFVLQVALDDFYVQYEINAYTNRANEMAVLYSRLHAQIQESFNAAGVEIMSSHYVNVRDGNTVTIPDAHRPKGYQAPSFRVELPKVVRKSGD